MDQELYSNQQGNTKKKMLERDVEKHLVKEIEKLGGKAYKFSSPSNRAIPDRLCCLPRGRKYLVECKAPGKDFSPLQGKVAKILRSLGHEVFLVDTKEKVDELCQMIKEDING